MPQNPSTNKISAFIGITLLIAIIGFTVFVNISIEEKELKKNEYKSFSQTDLDNFWKLDSIDAETGSLIVANQEYLIPISKKMGVVSSDKDGQEKSILNPIDEKYELGVLRFKTTKRSNKNVPLVFQTFIIKYCKIEQDYVIMNEIGNLFLNYQIEYIVSDSKYGNFTAIHLKNGQIIILLNKELQVADEYYKKIISKAYQINDSTKIIHSIEARKIYNEIYDN